MSIDFETALLETPPGAPASGYHGFVLPVPFAATASSKLLIGVSCALMGWSIRESTGLAGAIVELLSGGDANGELLASLALTAGFDPSASQTPTASTASGGNAVQTATIAAVAGVFNFITSLRITGLGATGATEVTATLTGVQGGTINYPVSVPVGATVPITPVFDTFGTRGLQASAVNTAISLALPAFGAGNTLESASISGYTQLAAGSDRTANTPGDGVQARSGVFLNVVSGTVKGTIWVRV